MENLHLATKPQNYIHHAVQVLQPPSGVGRKLDKTLQGKVKSKNEIIITRYQLQEMAWLFSQYRQKKPGWLRTRFLINQHRRKLLNQILLEAGLDKNWCSLIGNSKDWSGQLHMLYHEINIGQRCI